MKWKRPRSDEDASNARYRLKCDKTSRVANVNCLTFLIYLGRIKQIDLFIVIGFPLTLDRDGKSSMINNFLFSSSFSFRNVCLFMLALRSNCRTTQWLNYQRIDMEWGEAVVGCWITRVHTRYVECDRFYNKFVVRCDGGTPGCFLF